MGGNRAKEGGGGGDPHGGNIHVDTDQGGAPVADSPPSRCAIGGIFDGE